MELVYVGKFWPYLVAYLLFGPSPCAGGAIPEAGGLTDLESALLAPRQDEQSGCLSEATEGSVEETTKKLLPPS